MSSYLNTVTQEYPRHQGDLILLGWQIGEPLPKNWVEVQDSEPPSFEPGQTYYESFPLEVNGVWIRQWKIRALNQSEIDYAKSLAPETYPIEE